MSFARDTLQQLITKAQDDFASRVPGADARLPVNMINALSIMHAGGIHALNAKLEWAVRQIFPELADAEFVERYAARYDLYRLAPQFAIGDVVFTGSNGSTIPNATQLQTAAGKKYETTAEGTIAAGTAIVPIKAIDAGGAGNLVAGTTLSLLSPEAGINTQCTVDAGGITGGAEIEAIAALLERVAFREKNPPQGGAAHDYIAWARAAHQSVTRVWVYPQELGDNTVVVRIVTDNESSLTATAPVITSVSDYIEARRPTNAIVTVTSPTEVPVDFTIALEPNTTEVQTAVTAELKDLFRRVARPQGIVPISQLNEAISIAIGETDHTMSVPASNVAEGTNEIPVVGDITWL